MAEHMYLAYTRKEKRIGEGRKERKREKGEKRDTCGIAMGDLTKIPNCLYEEYGEG